MDFRQSPLQWLLATQSRGVQPGLDRMRRLNAVLGNPEQRLKCLHVAGTNGKGSVCAFAESMLRKDGHHTGLYTSPHLVDFSERIRIDGRPVAMKDLEEGIGRLQEVTRNWREEELPTFFELATALAFHLFARAECDIVVLETGLGGRFDATNTAPKVACAITPIALDHTEWLGESIQEIAREKAGIFRAGIPVVVAPQVEEVVSTLGAVAAERESPCLWGGDHSADSFTLGLAGSYQKSNASLALNLLHAGGFHPSEDRIRQGLAHVSWPGRFQRLREGKLVLDGAHNLHAARQLVQTWREEFGSRKCRLIFGALADKDPAAMLDELELIAEEILLVPVASPRSMELSGLYGKLQTPFLLCNGLKEALDQVFDARLPDPETRSPVLLTGSLFLVGEALALESGKDVTSRSQ